MIDSKRYPKLNDPAHDRPILSIANRTWLADWVWVLVPAVVLALAYFLR